jgi:hypothetical protein
MSHSSEKRSFLDYRNKVLCIDCSIVTYCINTKGITHIKTEYLLSMSYVDQLYKHLHTQKL